MKIFEYQNQRLCPRQRGQHAADFPQHAFARSANDLPQQGLADMARHLARELQRPRGRKRHQRFHDFIAAGSLTELPESVQNWIKRFRAAITLDTARFSDPRIVMLEPLGGNELLEQRGLADSWFTGNHHELTVAGSGPLDRSG